jgi:DNA-binding FrmR family transcriptional regulator
VQNASRLSIQRRGELVQSSSREYAMQGRRRRRSPQKRAQGSGPDMLDEPHKKDIGARLRRVEGQVRGIQRMIEEPRLCVDILQQLAAVDAALKRVQVAIFRYHVKRCLPGAIKLGRAEQFGRLAELADIVDQFCR